MSEHFQVLAKCGQARAGLLRTAHGPIETPVFMPVGTQATVKSLSSADLEALGARIILANTYHLAMRPGHELIRGLGGLHRFMAWPGAILSDSGGFQVFSQSGRRAIDEDGVTFQSHVDGSTQRLTPESAMAIQVALGSDIAMTFDECPPADAEASVLAKAMERTTRWARRCLLSRHNRIDIQHEIHRGSIPDIHIAQGADHRTAAGAAAIPADDRDTLREGKAHLHIVCHQP